MKTRHQLNEDETLIYAAGMAAHRRGESRPKQELSSEDYRLWRAGWRRVGRVGNSFTNNMRSADHHTKVEGVHCIHTEVETFDDALKVLEIRQRTKASSEAVKDRPRTWRQQLGADKARQKSPRGNPALVVQRDTDFEQRIIERVVTAIQLLKLGVEEMSVMSAMGAARYPAVNPKTLMDIIVSLCSLIRQPAPDFNVQRMTVHPPLRRCVNCGAELEKSELEYCRHCNPETESLRIESQLRREHYAKLGGLERETKQLSKLINKVKRKVIDHGDDKGHSGHPRQIVGGLEAGGRKEDVVLGGETPHQPSAGGTRDTES